MLKRNNPTRWLFRAVLCAALALNLAACSDSDDDDTTGSDTGGDNVGDGDDDAIQETVNADGTSTFIVPLSAEQEAPPVDEETATGEANLTIDPASGAISGSVSVSGLSGEAQAAHIHQAFGGINGDVLIALSGNDDGSLWTVPTDTLLDASALTALSEGALYINVHTEGNPGGEIRGQIIPLAILFEDSELSGDEEVPPVVTVASGVGVSTVNSESGAISATVFVSGLDEATMAHIHSGAAGVNGDVIITLEQDAENPGIWRTPVPSTLTQEQVDAFENEALYFNVHSDANPAGEIRGQL